MFNTGTIARPPVYEFFYVFGTSVQGAFTVDISNWFDLTIETPPITGSLIRAFTFGDKRAFIGDEYGQVWSSVDGINFNYMGSCGFSIAPRGLAFGSGYLVAAGGSNFKYSSDYGVTWVDPGLTLHGNTFSNGVVFDYVNARFFGSGNRSSLTCTPPQQAGVPNNNCQWGEGPSVVTPGTWVSGSSNRNATWDGFSGIPYSGLYTPLPVASGVVEFGVSQSGYTTFNSSRPLGATGGWAYPIVHNGIYMCSTTGYNRLYIYDGSWQEKTTDFSGVVNAQVRELLSVPNIAAVVFGNAGVGLPTQWAVKSEDNGSTWGSIIDTGKSFTIAAAGRGRFNYGVL